jgi:23S rRNA pseudouridine1911/1915/1917 synthase
MSARRGVAARSARLDLVLVELWPELSRSQAARLIRDGQVHVAGAVVDRPAHAVSGGDEVSVELPPPTPAEAAPEDLPIQIVHEDDDLVIVNKAAGMVVHPGAGHQEGTLVNALLHHVSGLSGVGGVERPGIVHRLDKGTSGLMVVAKHDLAHRHLAEQFAAHTARRRYLAVCLDAPDASAGTVRSFLARHPQDRVRWASTTEDRGKHAVTHWWVRSRARGLALFECELETGRTHQIRVHLSEQGWPLLGDPVYQRRRLTTPSWLGEQVDEQRPMLHAWRLVLRHPRTERALRFVAEPPADFCAVLDLAGLRWRPPDEA